MSTPDAPDRPRTLTERIAAYNARKGVPECAACGVRHEGAAWTPAVGWHDELRRKVPARDETGRNAY